MKGIFDIFKTSKAIDVNKGNTTNNSNLNNQHHKLNTNNNTKGKSNKKNQSYFTILPFYTNAKATLPTESSSKPSFTSNRPDSFITTKTQQIIKQPSNIIPPTNKSTLILKIVAATKQKLQEIRKQVFKRNTHQTNKIHYFTHSPPTSNYNLRQRPSTATPRLKYNIPYIIHTHLLPPIQTNSIASHPLYPMNVPTSLHSIGTTKQ